MSSKTVPVSTIPKAGKFTPPCGILTKNEIKKLNIIRTDTYEESCLKAASYDLRLGEKYIVPGEAIQKSDKKTANHLFCPYKSDRDYKIKYCQKENGILRIPEYSSIVFSTEEILQVPNNVAGRFDLRIRFAMQGLVLQVGTQIEPGYRGRLFGLLLNFSDKEICIPMNVPLLTAEFSYLSQAVEQPDNTKNNGVYDEIEDFIEKYPALSGTLESFLKKINLTYQEFEETRKEIKSHLSLYNAEKSQQRNNFITWILGFGAVFVAIFIPFICLYITKSTIDKDDYPFERIILLEKQKDSLKLELKTLTYKIDSIGKNSVQKDLTQQQNKKR